MLSESIEERREVSSQKIALATRNPLTLSCDLSHMRSPEQLLVSYQQHKESWGRKMGFQTNVVPSFVHVGSRFSE